MAKVVGVSLSRLLGISDSLQTGAEDIALRHNAFPPCTRPVLPPLVPQGKNGT